MEVRAHRGVDQTFAILRTEDEMNEDLGQRLRHGDELRPYQGSVSMLLQTRGVAPG